MKTQYRIVNVGKGILRLQPENLYSIQQSSTQIVTINKPILSTVLSSQTVDGIVGYINALNPVLVVGSGEIVKFNLTDTGRIFELNIRGRSFGVGQPAIVAANVLEVTEFLNKDIRLSNYPSTRNDGQLPTNKVLSTDANGNIKLYTIAAAPPPYLRVLIPDSTLPSITTNFKLRGAFFTPTMTVAIVGQTINYITFISDNEVDVNVTTGATEGSYAVTLNNGIQAVFPNALLIVLGTVFTPTSSDWENITGTIDLNNTGEARIVTAGVDGAARYSKPMSIAKKFSFYLRFVRSPLYSTASEQITDGVSFVDQVNGDLYDFRLHIVGNVFEFKYYKNNVFISFVGFYTNFNEQAKLRFYFNGTNFLVYINNVLESTLPVLPNNVKGQVNVKFGDIVEMKFVEHFT